MYVMLCRIYSLLRAIFSERDSLKKAFGLPRMIILFSLSIVIQMKVKKDYCKD